MGVWGDVWVSQTIGMVDDHTAPCCRRHTIRGEGGKSDSGGGWCHRLGSSGVVVTFFLSVTEAERSVAIHPKILETLIENSLTPPKFWKP
jgi:hypothetical protein